MKKQYVSLLTLLLSLSGFLFSCGDKMSSNAGALQFDSIQVNKTAHLFNDTAKPACNIIVNFAYPSKSSDETLMDSLNDSFIAACFGDKYMGDNPKEVVTEFVQNYIDEYLHDQEPMYTEDEKNREKDEVVGAWYSYYKTIESHVLSYEGNLLVYKIDYNEYTGGAHGMYTTTYLNMDLTLMRPLQLEDIFTGDFQEALTDLLWKQLMKDNKVDSHDALEDLGFTSTGDLTPTNNFYLSTKGITFYYNIYEITPYSMGPVSITLPYAEMKNILGNNPIVAELIG